MYQDGKQTVPELADSLGISSSTIRRRFSTLEIKWVQPPLSGGGYVHVDATYWGHNWGVMLAMDDATGKVLYMAFIKHETVGDYCAAIASIESRGYSVKGIVIDGMRSLFTFQREDCKGMPNTNNKLEGTFTDLKKNLNLHSGLSVENRKRFICGFFLASAT